MGDERGMVETYCSAMAYNAQTLSGEFDMFRLSKSKRIVDLSPNTVRQYAKEGLRIYQHGRVRFVSKAELADFIRRRMAQL